MFQSRNRVSSNFYSCLLPSAKPVAACFNLVIECLLISTTDLLTDNGKLGRFQSRNRVSSNFYSEGLEGAVPDDVRFNLVIECLLIST